MKVSESKFPFERRDQLNFDCVHTLIVSNGYDDMMPAKPPRQPPTNTLMSILFVVSYEVNVLYYNNNSNKQGEEDLNNEKHNNNNNIHRK